MERKQFESKGRLTQPSRKSFFPLVTILNFPCRKKYESYKKFKAMPEIHESFNTAKDIRDLKPNQQK